MRKSADVLQKPASLSKATRKFLAVLEAATPAEGASEAYSGWVRATRLVEEQAVTVEQLAKVVDAKGSLHPRWQEYNDALDRFELLTRQAFSACDLYRRRARQPKIVVADDVGADQSMLFNDVRAMVDDTIEANADGVQFDISLGAEIATLLAAAVKEESAGIPVFCSDCEEEVANG